MLGDSYRVNEWISAIVRRNIEELSISLDSVHELVPRTIFFSSLKSLSLKSVVFSDDYLTQKLFSGFPILEDLSLTDCNWMNIKFVVSLLPSLGS